MDQMRNVQRSTRTGEASPKFGGETKGRRAAGISTGSGQPTASNGAALMSWLRLLRSDCDGREVRCGDVSQQLLFAHEAASQAWLSGVLVRMQGVTGNRAVAAPNEAAIKSEDRILPSMRSL